MLQVMWQVLTNQTTLFQNSVVTLFWNFCMKSAPNIGLFFGKLNCDSKEIERPGMAHLKNIGKDYANASIGLLNLTLVLAC